MRNNGLIGSPMCHNENADIYIKFCLNQRVLCECSCDVTMYAPHFGLKFDCGGQFDFGLFDNIVPNLPYQKSAIV